MIEDNIYILNLEASYILRDYYTTLENKGDSERVVLHRKDLEGLYNVTIPYSLETIRLSQEHNFILPYNPEKRVNKSRCIVNITFESSLKLSKDKTITKLKMRNYLYENGFYIDEQKYVMYKRGSSKAKTGSVLFIKEEWHEKYKLRSRLGLKFEENEEMDLTSVYAYESLILSGLIETIDIDPNRILIIDDIYGKDFRTRASVTREVDKELVTEDKEKQLVKREIIKELITENEEIDIQNCLSDGQGLLDEIYFDGCKDKTMMLLRNDWFKCNAINTKLHNFLEKYSEDGKVKDMFGREKDIRRVDLVITPNSLKWLKLKDKFESKEECYDYWIKNIEPIFGVVKNDKIGNFEDCNRTTYQLLNSIQLTKNEINELATEEIEYVNMLKNDIDVFKMHIGTNLIEEKIDEALKNDGKELETSDMMSDLLAINSNFADTRKFKTWRKNQINQYIENLRKGKLRLSNTRYTTIVSNPYSMLQAVVGKYKEGECVENGHVVWCNAFKENQEFCISRNPHINAGNVMYATNKYYKEYEWFNLSGNMCVINANDTDVLDRLQGCDVDSDTILMLTHEILIKHAKENKWLTPINKVKGQKELKKNNMKELAKLDDMLQNNLIGKIINTSAIYNAYMSRAIQDNKDQDTIQKMYNASSMLSSLSQIELDRSKKSFPNIEIGNELKKIKNLMDKDNKKLIEKKDGELDFGNKIATKHKIGKIYNLEKVEDEEEMNKDNCISYKKWNVKRNIKNTSKIMKYKKWNIKRNIKNITKKNSKAKVKKEKITILEYKKWSIKRNIKNETKKSIKRKIKTKFIPLTNYYINYKTIKLQKNETKKTIRPFSKYELETKIINICKKTINKEIGYYINYKKEVEKTIVPKFFNIVAKPSNFRMYEHFPIAMDYLQEILETNIARKEETKDIMFKTLLVKAKDVSGKDVYQNQVEKIFNIVEKYGKAIIGTKAKNNILNFNLNTDNSITTYKRNRKNEALKELKDIKVNGKTVLYILKECFCKGKTDYSKYATYSSNLLYVVYKKEFISCFKAEFSNKDMSLIKDKNGSIKIWNKNYKKITKKEYIKMKNIGA